MFCQGAKSPSWQTEEKLQLFEAANSGRSDVASNGANCPLLTLVLDIATRWNSAYDMLTKKLKYEDAITTFLNFLKSGFDHYIDFSQIYA